MWARLGLKAVRGDAEWMRLGPLGSCNGEGAGGAPARN